MGQVTDGIPAGREGRGQPLRPREERPTESRVGMGKLRMYSYGGGGETKFSADIKPGPTVFRDNYTNPQLARETWRQGRVSWCEADGGVIECQFVSY